MPIQTKLTRLSLAILACIAGMPAFAQPESSGFVLEEVVVVAQKREESLQSVPVAVTAFSEEALEDIGARTISDLSSSVPSLDVAGTFRSAQQVTLRGITNTNNTELGDPATSFNVDGIYMARPQAATALMFDTERVEVLRGPQGTLFGRNSPAGAINLITKKPHMEGVDGSVSLVAGDYNRLGIQGAVNLPVSENFALRVAATDESKDSFQELGAGSLVQASDDELGETTDDTAFRVSSLWTPSDTVSWSFTYDQLNSDGVPPVMVLATSDTPRVPDVRTASVSSVDVTSIRSRIDWDLSDGVRLSYLASYNELDQFQIQSGVVGQNSIYNDFENESTTHEIQLSSIDADRLEWIFGAFLFEEENEVDFHVDLNPATGLRFVQPDRVSEAQAIFGQAAYQINDDLGLTVGARYSQDEKIDVGGRNFLCVGGIDPTDLSVNCTTETAQNDNSGDWSKPTYRVQLDWNGSDSTLFYGSVASGYKSGGFAAGGAAEYDEETVVTYEFGTKSDLLDGSLRLNTALYMSDFEDLQLSAVVELEGGGNARETRNAASASINGLEIEYVWLVSESARVQGFINYIDATLDNFPDSVDPISSGNTPVDASGNQLQQSPEWSFNIAWDQDFYLSGGSTLRSRVAATWRDDYFLRYNNAAFDEVDSFTTIDASLRYTTSDETWSAELFGKNLTDELVPLEVGGRPNGSGTALYSFRPPRTYGVRVNYDF